MANEKRLIDANALMDSFRNHMVESYDRNKCTLEENCKTCQPGCLWRKKVMDAPTVDAVPVVRCKDCKHWWKTNELCNHPKCCDGMVSIVEAPKTHFCSYGERKETE